MFTLYTDKINTFKCKITLEGASESSTLARLIIEGENHNLMFDGKVKNGLCEVNIGKFKNFDNFKSKGKIKLEVIADDVCFTPWQSEYNIKQDKKVVAEVDEKASSKPLVEVTEISYNDDITKKNSINHGKKIVEMLVKGKINIKQYESLDVMLNKNYKSKLILKNYISKNKLSESVLDSTLEYLVDKFLS